MPWGEQHRYRAIGHWGKGSHRCLKAIPRSRPSQRLAALLLGITLSLGPLAGCSTLGLSGSAPNPENEESNQFVERSVRGNAIVSRPWPVSLGLRSGWRPAPPKSLHPEADLQAYNPNQAIFLIVLGESSTNVPPGNLNEQAARYIQLMKGGFTRVITDEAPTGVSMINNNPAVQYELRGEVLGKSVAYLHTTIQTGDAYYQVVTWTPDTRHAANAAEMRAVVEEFGPNQR